MSTNRAWSVGGLSVEGLDTAIRYLYAEELHLQSLEA